MNLDLAHQLLAAADEQPYGFLKVSGYKPAREVELLAEGGFVEATVQPGANPPTAVINRLTTKGEKLLNVLRSAADSETVTEDAHDSTMAEAGAR